MNRPLIILTTLSGFMMFVGACNPTTAPVSPTPETTVSPTPTDTPTISPTDTPTTSPTTSP